MAGILAVPLRWRLVAALAAAAVGVCAQTLAPKFDSGRLLVENPGFRFLEGKALERLHNGAAIVVSIQISLLDRNRGAILTRAAGRFAVSYDLWEERFAVTLLGRPGKSVSHLSASESEAWCLNQLPLSTLALSPSAPFWLRLDVRFEDRGDDPPLGEDLTLTLARLVEFFSRPPAPGESRKRAEAGPFQWKDFR